MDLFARVNILDGRAVRLPHGDLDDVVFLDADPVQRALGWIAKGTDRLLVVDLDAAAFGDYKNRPLVRDLVGAVGVPVHVAGGIRSPQAVETTLEMGAARAVMGTAAIEDQVMIWDVCRDFPDRIVVSLDVNPDEEIATRGWRHNSGRYLEEVLIELSSAGVGGFMVTEVGRDALEEPPNLDALRRTLSIVDESVVAAGGVRDLGDLAQLRDLTVDGKRLGGVVVGREVTAGRFTVEEAVALLGGRATEEPGPWDRADLEAAAVHYASEAGEDASRTAHAFIEWLAGGGNSTG